MKLKQLLIAIITLFFLISCGTNYNKMYKNYFGDNFFSYTQHTFYRTVYFKKNKTIHRVPSDKYEDEITIKYYTNPNYKYVNGIDYSYKDMKEIPTNYMWKIKNNRILPEYQTNDNMFLYVKKDNNFYKLRPLYDTIDLLPVENCKKNWCKIYDKHFYVKKSILLQQLEI